jgi:hypothetical protein
MTARTAERRGAVDSGAMGLGDFANKAKDFADQHDEQVDQGLEKAGDVADERTGGGHSEQIDRGVDIAQERTGEGDTRP